MSEVSPESALELRQAILDHDTWNESMPEFADFAREGFVTIDGGEIERNQLSAPILARLGVIETDIDESEYRVDLGRRINRTYGTLGDMYRALPEGQRWNPSNVYDDYGHDTAFIRVGRSHISSEGVEAALFAYYTVSAEEPFEPDRPPLCEVDVDIEDHLPMRQLFIELGEKGGSLVDMARALGIDPMTGERDSDRPNTISDTDFRINLANELGEPLSEEQIAELRADEAIAIEMRSAETEIHPLTTAEILGLATLARSIQTSTPC